LLHKISITPYSICANTTFHLCKRHIYVGNPWTMYLFATVIVDVNAMIEAG